MPPVDVLFTTVFPERLGGSERVLWTFLRLCDRDRVRPFVIFHDDGPMVEEVATLGIGVEVVPTGRFREVHRFAAATARMARTMRRRRPDVIAHWLTRAQVYGAPAAALAGLSGRSVWFQRHLVDGSDWMDRVATRLPARAVGTPSAQAAARQASTLRPSRPTFWVHNGIEIPPPVPGERLDELRGRYGLDPGRPVLGIVGRLQPWKGQHRFLQALALLRERGVDVQGLVVGGTQHGVAPDYPAQLDALTADLGLAGAVTFTGQVADPQSHFALCDIAVSASDEESFGLVLLEAMAHGVPLVAVDHGGPGEILRDGETGILVPGAEPGQLADGIARLLSDPALRERIAERSAADVRARFTADHMVRELETCFELLARGIVPASAARQPA